MIPERLTTFMTENGTLEKYASQEIFHSQDFAETLFMLQKGYVKRYQITAGKQKVIELIYGPGHIFPLSQLYKKIFGIEQNQDNLVYVYQAMSDIEIFRIDDDAVLNALDKESMLYQDLFFEGGLRLKSNIERLASNALHDDYKKVTHQLICLADEFGDSVDRDGKESIKIMVPLKPVDMAEQLNISIQVAEAVLASLNQSGLITTKDNYITIPNTDLLKDTYL